MPTAVKVAFARGRGGRRDDGSGIDLFFGYGQLIRIARDLAFAEEEGDFAHGVFVTVGSVDGIPGFAVSELATDGSRRGFAGIRISDELAERRHSIFFFQYQYDHGTCSHK